MSFFQILGMILPSDGLIFFRGVGIPPTSKVSCGCFRISLAVAMGLKVGTNVPTESHMPTFCLVRVRTVNHPSEGQNTSAHCFQLVLGTGG